MPADTEQAAVRRCEAYRRSLPLTDLAVPARAMNDRAVAKWVRDRGVTIDIRAGQDLAVAIAMGIRPMQMVVHADGMSESDFRATVNLAPARIVVSSTTQINVLAAAVEDRTQRIFIRVIDGSAPGLARADGHYVFDGGFRLDSTELDRAVDSLFNYSRLELVGLYCDVGANEHDFISYPAAIGQLVTEMNQIRRRHGVVLSLLGLGGGRFVLPGDLPVALAELANLIEESLDDACATTRFPRPIVVLCPGSAMVEQQAAY